MIVADNSRTSEAASSQGASTRFLPRGSQKYTRRIAAIHRIAWACLFLASLGASWFAYQFFLVPQPGRFAPNWGNAQWIQASGSTTPVAYFRYTTSLVAIPDGAFVTIAASQTFRLYVNGSYVGSNYTDFVQGIFPRTYMYDITASLRSGANVVAIRVANVDQQIPGVKMNIGFARGNFIYYHGSGSDWLATFQDTNVYPRYASNPKVWATTTFDASSWHPAQRMVVEPVTAMLTENPLIYERPMALHWLSAGLGHDAYFVRQVSLPFGITGAWLRLAATGIANIYINGYLYIAWNGQPDVPRQNLADYLSANVTNVEYRAGLIMGVYNITSYLHPGVNTIAVHVLSSGVSAAQVGLDNLSTAMSTDMLLSNLAGNDFWAATDNNWHASIKPVAGWEQGSSAALGWTSSIVVARPGAVQSLYLPDNTTPRNQQLVPLPLSLFVILMSVGGVIGLWLLMSLTVMRCYYHSKYDAFEAMSLAYLPALALEALLLVLSREPQIPQPFPYTWFWGVVLLVIVGIGYLLLWVHARAMQTQAARESTFKKENVRSDRIGTFQDGLLRLYHTTAGATSSSGSVLTARFRFLAWLQVHWPLILLILLAIPMISYNLSYEPYWQDELASYYASRGILAHGLPFFLSGFLYPKSELFSYMLALWTTLFGDQQGVPRLISVIEYLVSLPLLYRVGCYFFDRRVALFATAMLAFSPVSLVWGRQMRMYEQAQVLTLLTVYLFYRAIEERQKVHLVYLAAACLVLDYLSHEEVFIILPGLLLCILVFSRDAHKRLPSVLYQKHWWIAGILTVGIIGLQLLVAQLSHPPVLGTDTSQRPLVQFTTVNVSFYLKLFFYPMGIGHGTYPFITVNSVLAAVGCILAKRATDKRVKYCTVFLIVSLLTLTFAFVMEADRYVYPVLTFYYLMGAYAMLVLMRALWSFARPHMVLRTAQGSVKRVFGGYLSRPMRAMVTCTVGLVCASVLIVPMLPLSGYNLFIDKVVGFSYHRHYPDYDAVGQYMHQHMQASDIVISVSPAISVRYFVGHVNYFLSIDRALFVFERNGHIIETATGAEAILSQDDFQAVLSRYKRIWIVADDGVYQSGALQRFTFPPDFHIVFEGYGSAVYFRGS